MVGIAIIGCGSITKLRHAPECHNNKNIRLCGFFDIDQARSKEFAHQYDCKAYSSYEEVLKDASVDGVIICTANKFHCEMTLQAFSHGKHVLCEKPIAVTLEEAQEMIDASAKANKYLMIAHHQRFEPGNKKIKEILDSGKMGRILSFRTGLCHAGPEYWSVDQSNATWFLDKSRAGLGALGDVGIHKADLIRWLINDNIKYVTAKIATLNKRTPEGELINLEDNAFCILESASGIVGTLEASWTHYGKGNNSVLLSCENGILEGDTKTVLITMKDGSQEMINVEKGASGMAEAFAHCITTNTPPSIDGEEGKKALAIVLKCIESSELNSRAEL